MDSPKFGPSASAVAPSEPQDVNQAKVYYCTRHPLYEQVKPYLIDFESDSSFPRTNIIPEPHDVFIKDIRGNESDFSFEDNGFAVLEMQTTMQEDDFEDPAKIRDIYCEEVAGCLLSYLGAAAVQVFDFAVRKRHQSYPFQVTTKLPTLQPALQVHVGKDTKVITGYAAAPGTDKTADSSQGNLTWVIDCLSKNFSDKTFAKNRCTYVNVWRPLRGPVLDWSLAMCDAQTIKSTEEFMPTDVLGGKHGLSEDVRVFYSQDHKWYYLSNQMPNELLLFRQSDTETSKMGVPHTSFSNRAANRQDFLRESIEIRAIVYHR